MKKPTLIRAAAAVMLLMCVLAMTACGRTADPSPAAAAFLDAYIAGDSETAQSLCANYSSLSLDTAQDSEYHKLLSDLLADSLSYDIAQSRREGKAASVSADITFFDFRKLSAVLTDVTTEEAMDRKETGESLDTEESVMALLCDVVRGLTSDPTQYYSTERADISMRYEDGEWKVVLDDALAEMLMGYAGQEAESYE
ncbi:MAG: hypothetical protein IJP17_07120 [Clostridia bacterium]|nr:hypothetical protein [Clostridia bacterium]